MTDLVLRHDRDGAVTLTLNRPDKLNALNVDVFVELDAHVKQLAGETDTVGLVILRGAGRCFSAGHDLGDISVGEKLPEPHYQSKVIERLANLPQPVISAVHGHCYTGALELALVGDIIFAAEGAKFADTHAKWALTPVWGLSQRLPRRVGTYRARELMLTCRTVGGVEAERIGLADVCVPDVDFDARLEALAAEQSPDNPRRIMLRGDTSVDYGNMMKVMGELNRAGLNSVSMVATPVSGGSSPDE